MQHDTASNQLPPTRDDRDASTSRLDAHTHAMTTRRNLLRWTIRVSYGAFALAFAIPALALRTLTQQTREVAAGDVLVYAAGEREGTPLNVEQIPAGSAVQAFPQDKTEDSNNLIEIVRLSEDASSVVAYSAICTHLGCSVLPNLGEDGLIFCPCHASAFDPADNAAVRGGPAGRPLPSLPIEVGTDGAIVARGGFSGEVGPD
jgi:rieske iron-sulfur protein